MKEKRNENPYICKYCLEVFSENFLGHCPGCGSHYPVGYVCGNCHVHKIKKTMVKAMFTTEQYIRSLERGRYTCQSNGQKRKLKS